MSSDPEEKDSAVRLRALAALNTERYEVESEQQQGYDDYDAKLYLVCHTCRREELARRNFFHVGSLMLPELGCVGPVTALINLGLTEILHLALEHEESAHGGRIAKRP